ncbi:hypothetical protein GCM10009801_09050 [Streptomyces albiaxialis]|uniref:DUF2637 domain-containing protein n=1 Tax=Streptomyces albiaxialis TaxID=329523 RepID=A0ABP5H7B0_9ACTN
MFQSTVTRPQAASPQSAAERYTLVAAGLVIAALTAGGFWLSYAHLSEVAGAHGLGGSPIRQWAWPATLDAFIVAGELLMLRAGLRQVTDGWAIGLTATGSVGSIALNAAGVIGTRDAADVPLLDYVVAAVPPTAAMLAFAALMRQIHQLVDRTADRPQPAPGQVPESSLTASTGPGGLPSAASGTPHEPAPDTAARSHDRGHPTRDAREQGDDHTTAEEPRDSSESVPAAKEESTPQRTGRPPNASLDELLAIARPVVARTGGDVDREKIAKEIRDVHSRKVSNDRLKKIVEILENDQERLWDAADDIANRE